MQERTSGIVTPEAVLLQFDTANVASRGLARLIDIAVQFTIFLVLAMTVGTGAAFGGSSAEPILIAALSVIAFLCFVGYPVAFESLWGGRTLGKAALGLRVVTRDGAPVRFRHAAIRGIIGLAEVFAFTFISLISCAASRLHQRIGDVAAGTIVIRERAAASPTVALTFPPPPGFEGYVRTLDVSAVTPAQYQVVRSFLMRVFQLTPEARARIAVRLANPLATELRHTPPANLGPEQWLVCVAAAYQQRHGGPAAMPPPPMVGGWGPRPPVGPYGGPPGGSHLLPPPAGFGTPAGAPQPAYGGPTVPPGYGPPAGAWAPPTR